MWRRRERACAEKDAQFAAERAGAKASLDEGKGYARR